MRIGSEVKIRTVAGEKVVFLPAQGATDMNRVVAFNGSACLLCEVLAGCDFEVEDAAEVLAGSYGLPRPQALADAAKWVEEMRQNGLLAPSPAPAPPLSRGGT